MKNLLPLMQREWMQHRFGWMLMAAIPLGLGLLILVAGQVQWDTDSPFFASDSFGLAITMVTVLVTMVVLFLVVWVTALFQTASVTRRDHADRSIEFWLSLPTGHTESYVAPLLVHMVLAPAAALLVGLAGGIVLTVPLALRFTGIGEWFQLPWGEMLLAWGSLALRVMAGLPLSLLWLAPLLLGAMLCTAYFKRWGVPILLLVLGLGGALSQWVLGAPMLWESGQQLVRQAGLALAGASGQGVVINGDMPASTALSFFPTWAWRDLMAALSNLASPLFAASIVISAALLWVLVQWRARGAGGGA